MKRPLFGPPPGCAVSSALDALHALMPESVRTYTAPFSIDTVGAHFAKHCAAIPATSRAGSEDAVLYSSVGSRRFPVLMGLYGDEERVRGWLPGLPEAISPSSVETLLAPGKKNTPHEDAVPRCQTVIDRSPSLDTLPLLKLTPRDAGPYVTLGVVCALDEAGKPCISVHRLLKIGNTRLTLWMLPGRGLRRLAEKAFAKGRPLPVTVNIGAPPAVVIASALNREWLPSSFDKIDIAALLADHPIALAKAVTQPAPVFAESQIVLEGVLEGTFADEAVSGSSVGPSLPEFLGYDGSGRSSLPVFTLSAMTHRDDAVYQAVLGPGREQSIILGLGGAITAAMVLAREATNAVTVRDLHFPASGGGMLTLVVQVVKNTPDADRALSPLARRLFEAFPMLKTVLFVDEDVVPSSAEDVMWALTTRCDLRGDCIALDGFPTIGPDPSQAPLWRQAKGLPREASRTILDATIPFALRSSTRRSFESALIPLASPLAKEA